METSIGSIYRQHDKSRWCAVLIAVIAVGADVYLVGSRDGIVAHRFLLMGISVCALALLGRGERASLGFTFRMTPGYRYWIKVTLLIGTAIGVFCVVVWLILPPLGVDIPLHRLHPKRMVPALQSACITAPILEEVLYRLVLCAPLAALAGSWAAIFLSGAVFAGVHFAYGNPAPDNFIAGYVLAWAYLKSGSILLPVLLHSVGNACAVASQVICWYLTT